MKILIVGGTRFFGVHLVKALIRNGHDVTIATRGRAVDSFDSSVKRIIFERTSPESIRENLSEYYDVVFDNLNFAPNNTIAILDNINTKKYIYTSSLSVYSEGINLKENAFDPLQYPIRYGERQDFEYGEGKRLCEAVAFQKYTLPITAVRFPIVLGKDDYTKRLWFYVDRIKRKLPLNISSLNTMFCFIESVQAGEFLAFLADKDIKGTINASSDGFISMREIVNIIEEISGIKAIVSESGEIPPYDNYVSCTMNTEKAKALGFEFQHYSAYIKDVIKYYINEE